MKHIVWVGSLPHCDFCKVIDDVITPARYDSPVRTVGIWANMCGPHYASHGLPPESDLVNFRVTQERETTDADIPTV